MQNQPRFNHTCVFRMPVAWPRHQKAFEKVYKKYLLGKTISMARSRKEGHREHLKFTTPREEPQSSDERSDDDGTLFKQDRGNVSRRWHPKAGARGSVLGLIPIKSIARQPDEKNESNDQKKDNQHPILAFDAEKS